MLKSKNTAALKKQSYQNNNDEPWPPLHFLHKAFTRGEMTTGTGNLNFSFPPVF